MLLISRPSDLDLRGFPLYILISLNTVFYVGRTEFVVLCHNYDGTNELQTYCISYIISFNSELSLTFHKITSHSN